MNPPENSSHNASNSDAFTYLNDVSRMSCFPDGTPVSRIFHPRCEADVVNILQSAHHARKQVGIRGTKHSIPNILDIHNTINMIVFTIGVWSDVVQDANGLTS